MRPATSEPCVSPATSKPPGRWRPSANSLAPLQDNNREQHQAPTQQLGQLLRPPRAESHAKRVPTPLYPWGGSERLQALRLASKFLLEHY